MSDLDKVTTPNTDDSKNDVVFASSGSITSHKSSAPVFADGAKKGTSSAGRSSYKRASYKTAAPEKGYKKKTSKVKMIAVAAASVVVLAGVCIGIAALFSGNGGESIPTAATNGGAENSATKMKLKDVNTDTIVFGNKVTIQGVDVSGMTLSNAYAALDDAQKSVRDKINITVKNGKKTLTLTEDDFNYKYNTADVLLEAYHYSRGELETLSVDHNNDKSSGVTDFPLTATLDESAIEDAANALAKKVNVKAVDAHVAKFEPTEEKKFTYANGTVGKQLDIEDAVNQISTILASSNKTGSISLSMSDIPFTVTLDTIKKKTELISSYSTTSVSPSASNYNMRVAAAAINGTVIDSGETWSFNNTTGDSTTGENGYIQSNAISGGEIVQEYGGGICQVATTIYNAGIRANMEVVERMPHQYASVYVPVGLDATINYGSIDLKMKNNSKYPIYMATYTYDNNGDGLMEVMIELYGEKPSGYDEIVPIAWCVENNGSTYSTYSSLVYFKDGEELKRVRLWRSTYDYHGESAYQLAIPEDIENGPKDVSPTNKAPVHYG